MCGNLREVERKNKTEGYCDARGEKDKESKNHYLLIVEDTNLAPHVISL